MDFTASTFSRVFRAETFTRIEYSYNEDSSQYGLMIGGQESFLEKVRELVSHVPYAGDWFWAALRFASFVRSDKYLLRVDCRSEKIVALTLYCKFPIEPNDERFHKALDCASPMLWEGPSPGRIASALGLPGPRGVAFRVNQSGDSRTALYYRLESPPSNLKHITISTLALRCGLSSMDVSSILGDIQRLYTPGPIGVIGVDPGNSEVVGGIKFYPAIVPFDKVIAFLREKGATSKRIEEITRIANSLRARWASYIGVHYNSKGFAGWRVYFSLKPAAYSPAMTTKIVREKWGGPILDLPHY